MLKEIKYVFYILKKIRKNFFSYLKNDDFSKVDLLEFISDKIDKNWIGFCQYRIQVISKVDQKYY